MTAISLRPARELIKRTTTRCPVCRRAVPGEVWREGVRPAQVFLRRVCPEHGESSACLATDARFYWLAKGSEANACCQTGSGERGARSEPADVAVSRDNKGNDTRTGIRIFSKKVRRI